METLIGHTASGIIISTVYIISDKPEALLNAGIAAIACVAWDAAFSLVKELHL